MTPTNPPVPEFEGQKKRSDAQNEVQLVVKVYICIGVIMFVWGLIDVIRAGISPAVPWICAVVWFCGAVLWDQVGK